MKDTGGKRDKSGEEKVRVFRSDAFVKNQAVTREGGRRCGLLAMLALTLFLAACASGGGGNGADTLDAAAPTPLNAVTAATAPATDPADAASDVEHLQFDERDVFEPFNRYVFEVNLFLDLFLLRPVATWYAGLLPQFARIGVGRFFDNLKSPVVLANHLLQGDNDAAGNTLRRFAINSSIGFLGFRDMAEKRGYPPMQTDFGQTAGAWGVPHGPFLMLPLFGPSTARDALGIGVDAIFDPLSYNIVSPSWILPSLSGWRVVNTRARYLGQLESLYETSVDPYASLRSLYFQGRVRAPAGGAAADELDIDALPDIDEFDFSQ